MALTVPNYTAQSFDQDDWLAKEHEGGRDAALSFATLKDERRLFSQLASGSTADAVTPEYGASPSIGIHHMAGHQFII